MFADKKSGNDHWTGSRLLENLNYMLDHYVDIVVPKKIETWIITISVGVYFSIFFGLAIISFYYNQFWINHHLNIAKKCLQPSNSILRGVVRKFLGIRQQHWRQRGSPGAGVGYPGSHGYPMKMSGFLMVFWWLSWGSWPPTIPIWLGEIYHPQAFRIPDTSQNVDQQKFGMTPPKFRVNKPANRGVEKPSRFKALFAKISWDRME